MQQAFEFIEEIRDQTLTGMDVTIDNIMVRRTPHGLQLVYSDPLF